MFRCDCHERTCSPGTNQRTQIGEEWLQPHSHAGLSDHLGLLRVKNGLFTSVPILTCLMTDSDLSLTHIQQKLLILSCLIFFSSLLIIQCVLPGFPSLTLSPYIYSHILGSPMPLWETDKRIQTEKMEVEHGVLALCLQECQRLYPSIFPLTIQCNPQLKHSRWQGRDIEKESWREGEKCTMALLQTIAINGIIFSPQRSYWGNNELYGDSTPMIHWMFYIQYMTGKSSTCYLSAV